MRQSFGKVNGWNAQDAESYSIKQGNLLKGINNKTVIKDKEFQKFSFLSNVKLGNKERFDMEQIGNKEPFPVTNLPFTS